MFLLFLLFLRFVFVSPLLPPPPLSFWGGKEGVNLGPNCFMRTLFSLQSMYTSWDWVLWI